jgi:hypothetical protein
VSQYCCEKLLREIFSNLVSSNIFMSLNYTENKDKAEEAIAAAGPLKDDLQTRLRTMESNGDLFEKWPLESLKADPSHSNVQMWKEHENRR